MNFDNLIKLARGSNMPIDDLDTDNMSDDIKAALAELMTEDKKATAKAAALQILEITKRVRSMEEDMVQEIRCIRRREAMLKSTLDNLKKEKEAAAKTNNYLRLALSAGYNVPPCLLNDVQAMTMPTPSPTQSPVQEVQRKKITLRRTQK